MASDIYLNKLSKQVTMTVHVHLTKQFRFRKWLAVQLIKLATVVLGCGLKIDDPPSKENG